MTIWPDRRHHGAGDPRRARCWPRCACRRSRPLRLAATAFVEFFRATPLILQIYWAFYVLPAFFDIRSRQLDAPRIVGLACNISAFNSETFRAGIVSIRQGQWNAGLALGMSRPQVFFRIVLPQAVMRVLPALAIDLGVAVQGHLARLGDRGRRPVLRRAAAARRDLPHPRGADRDGGALLADGLSAGQAGRLDPPPLRGWSNEPARRRSSRVEDVVEELRRASSRSTACRSTSHRGEVVCLIGPSGSGKSTCCAAPTRSSRSTAAASLFEGRRSRRRADATCARCAGAWAWCSRTSSCSRT